MSWLRFDTRVSWQFVGAVLCTPSVCGRGIPSPLRCTVVRGFCRMHLTNHFASPPTVVAHHTRWATDPVAPTISHTVVPWQRFAVFARDNIRRGVALLRPPHPRREGEAVPRPYGVRRFVDCSNVWARQCLAPTVYGGSWIFRGSSAPYSHRVRQRLLWCHHWLQQGDGAGISIQRG